jgi:cell wall-associated NlpC family hydrolase
MMVVRDNIVRIARTWLGTPFHHQGRVKGAGVDCAGLVIGVASELGLSAFDTSGYGRRPDTREMENICHAQMMPIALDDVRPGDVYLIEIDRQPQHLAFATDIGLLHAYAPARRVVEHRIDQDWADRLIAAFALPGVA